MASFRPRKMGGVVRIVDAALFVRCTHGSLAAWSTNFAFVETRLQVIGVIVIW